MTEPSPSADVGTGRLPGRRRSLTAGMLACQAAILASCAQAPPLHYYVLAPEAPVAGFQPVAAAGRTTVGLQPVEIADYLDRTEIVTRRGDNAIRLSDLDRWGEQLDVQVGRVVAQNLQRLVPNLDVFLLPTTFVVSPDRELVLEIERFDADDQGLVHLDGRWQLSIPGESRVVAERRIAVTDQAAGIGSEQVSAAMSRAVGRLSRDIASALR